MTRLDNKVAIVTGAAQGMGEMEARLLVDAGAQVIMGDIRDGIGEKLDDELGESARYVHLDVSRETHWRMAIQTCQAHFGPPTILVNNAGIAPISPIRECSEEDFRRAIDVNLIGCFLGMKAVLEPMISAGGGSIINISSANGFVASPGLSGYVSSKFGVRGLTRCGAVEFGKYGIRVNSICPGPIDTAMSWEGLKELGALSGTDHAMDLDEHYAYIPLARAGKAEEIAKVVVFLASDDSSYATGADFLIDGGTLAGIET